MKEITENIIKEYKEIKYLNDRKIEQMNNENLIIENFLRDIKLIVNCYENKISKLEEKLKLAEFNYKNCLSALAEYDSELKKYLESKVKGNDVK